LAWYYSSNSAAVIRVLHETAHASDAWYEEIDDPGYDFNNPGYSSGIGHFTQMVWKTTTKLGCGVSGSYLTCRYHPQGNFIGRFEENVLPLVGDGGSNDGGETDGGDTTPTPADPSNIQEALD